MPSLVQFLDKNKFLVGNIITWPDFLFFEVIDMMDWITDKKVTKNNATLKKYADRMIELPGLKEYWNSEICMKRPFNNKDAVFNN